MSVCSPAPRRPTISTTPEPTPTDVGRPPETRGRLRGALRRRIDRSATLRHSYRLAVGIAGTLVLCAGAVMIPFPGPGWLVVIAGLAILSTEFTWAERLLNFTKRHVFAWMRWIGAQSLGVRLLVGLATALFVYGVVVLALHLTGVPSWVPSWIPLWH